MIDQFPIIIKRIRSSRNLRLKVNEKGEVIVTAPSIMPNFFIKNFISKHREWIISHRKSVLDKRQNLTNSRSILHFRGRQFEFRLSVTNQKNGVEILKDQIVVYSPTEDHQTVRLILENWYKAKAKRHFLERVPILADLLDLDIKRVTIRSARTRWGSCSSRKSISINWRLILAPDEVSDYVVFHELTHILHMNHSRVFWQTVAQFYPNHSEAERWLKDNHHLLNF